MGLYVLFSWKQEMVKHDEEGRVLAGLISIAALIIGLNGQ